MPRAREHTWSHTQHTHACALTQTWEQPEIRGIHASPNVPLFTVAVARSLRAATQVLCATGSRRASRNRRAICAHAQLIPAGCGRETLTSDHRNTELSTVRIVYPGTLLEYVHVYLVCLSKHALVILWCVMCGRHVYVCACAYVRVCMCNGTCACAGVLCTSRSCVQCASVCRWVCMRTWLGRKEKSDVSWDLTHAWNWILKMRTTSPPTHPPPFRSSLSLSSSLVIFGLSLGWIGLKIWKTWAKVHLLCDKARLCVGILDFFYDCWKGFKSIESQR